MMRAFCFLPILLFSSPLEILASSSSFSSSSSEHITASTSSEDDTATRLSIQSILIDISKWQKKHQHQREEDKSTSQRPFVTITYAQSLDGKIALVRPTIEAMKTNTCDDVDDATTNNQNKIASRTATSSSSSSSNYPLSDPKSLQMTHALRSIHDGILVGSTTLAIDNPRLNNRLWKHDRHQPRPIVLDTHLKLNPTLWRASNVLVCCSMKAAHNAAVQENDDKNSNDSMPQILPCPVNPNTGRLDLDYLLQQLKTKHGIESIMVEGGASVLTSFYSRPDLVDCLCITIAPKLLLWNGLLAIQNSRISSMCGGDNDGSPNPHNQFVLDSSRFDSTKFIFLGNDSIFLAKMKAKQVGEDTVV